MKATATNYEREEWNSERARLTADYDRVLSDTEEAAAIALERQIATAVEHVRTALLSEVHAKQQELERSWDAERSRLIAEHERSRQSMLEEHDRLRSERNRLNDEAELASRMLADARLEQLRLESELEQARAAEKPSYAIVQSEVSRVEGLIQAIAKLLDDPSTELSLVIRKSVERAELEAYLKGIQFRTAS